MTKARLKRFLSVVVALFLFVCSVVVGFSVDDTLVFPYYFPFFTDAHFTFAPSYNPTGFVSWSPSSSDSAPFLSYTYSGSVTSQHLYLFLSQNNKSFTYDTTDILGKPVTYTNDFQFKGVKSGYYSSTFSFSTSSLLSDAFLSDIAVSVYYPYVSGSTTFVPTKVYFSDLVTNLNGVYDYVVSFSYYLPVSFSSVGESLVGYSISFPSSLTLSSLGFSPASFLSFDSSLSFNSIQGQMSLNFANLISYFNSTRNFESDTYKASVPSGLGQQQQEAQNHLTDYENKEQAVFDNLNTSLDNLNLDQYTSFSPSLLSSMSFINGYVTDGFDGLGDFKIILFLPMVLGISLSVIGRMGHMLSSCPTTKRPTRGKGGGS